LKETEFGQWNDGWKRCANIIGLEGGDELYDMWQEGSPIEVSKSMDERIMDVYK